MDDLELGLDSETVNKSQGSQPIRRNISLKLKQSSGAPNDCQKSAKREKASSKTSARGSKNDIGDGGGGSHGNRSSLPSSRSANYVESILKSKFLKVDNKMNVVGEKVADPLIHTCQICLLPILIYGRLMPCRHIFCFTCAKKTEKNCPRCSESVGRIEQSALGTVFVCTVGGSKHGVSGCHRTYLSQRDLQAHFKHRHMNQRSTSQQHQQQQQQQLVASQDQLQQQRAVLLGPNVMHPPPSVDYLGQLPPSSVQYVAPPPIYLSRPPQQQMMMAGPPQGGHVISVPQQVMMMQQQQQQQQQQQNSDLRMNVSTTPQQQQQNIMVMTPRSTNLITVPIQDDRSLQQFQTELQQQAHFQHNANAQFANSLVQHQQQQQQVHQAQQQQLQASQTQFLMGQPQLLNRPPMVNQGHLRPQAGAGGQLVGQQLVSTQMNIHAFQRFEDSGQHAQYISTPQGVTTSAWITKRPPMGQQGPATAGPNQQIQFY